MAGETEFEVRLTGGADLADALARLGSSAQLVVYYRSGSSVGLRQSEDTVTAHVRSGGQSGRAWDLDVEPLRSKLLAESWTTTSDFSELVKSWPAGSDPASMYDELRRIYVLAYAVTPRWLPARVLEDEPWTSALPYLALYLVGMVVVPGVVGALIAIVVAGALGRDAGAPLLLIGAITAALVLNITVLGGDRVGEKLGRDWPPGWAFFLVPLLGTFAVVLLVSLLFGR